MSNQVYSNDDSQYASDNVIVNGQLLDNLVNQPVLTTSSPTFFNVSTGNIQTNHIISGTDLLMTVGGSNSNQLLAPDVNTLPGSRVMTKSFSGQTVGTSILSTTISNLQPTAATIEIQLQFVDIAGSFPGQYGSYYKLTRMNSVSGSTVIGADLSQILSRDAGLTTASITLTGGVLQVIVGFVGVAGETLNVSGTITVYQ